MVFRYIDTFKSILPKMYISQNSEFIGKGCIRKLGMQIAISLVYNWIY